MARVDDVWRPGTGFAILTGAFVVACALAAAVGGPGAGAATAAARTSALLVVLVGALLGLVLHEWAHAAVAYRGGDESVVDSGYLELDVRRHAHPLLSVGFPILCVAAGGLPLPGGAVFIRSEWLRSRWWDSAVSAAGPGMSLSLGLVLVTATELAPAGSALGPALAFLALIQFGLVLLNLAPVPGLDGFGIIEPHLSDEVRRAVAPVRQYGILVLAALVFGTPLLDFLWDWASAVGEAVGLDPVRTAQGQALTRP